MTRAPDLLLRGGRAPEPVDVRVVAGRVAEVGARLEPFRGEAVVDLAGRFVRHGLRDAHAHVVEEARARRELELSGARSAAAVADLVAAAPGTDLLRGARFRDTGWPDEPTSALLDRAAPGRVVVLRSQDMHSAWLSGAALALCGLADHPTGLLREHEAWQALARLPAPSAAADDDAVAELVAAAHRRGLTAVRDFSFEDAHRSWQRRQDAGGLLPLRVDAVVLPEQLPAYVARGLATGDGDDYLTVGPLKLFADGALGSRTARCLTPYAGGDDRGVQLLDPEQLRSALEQARAAGFGVAVHAIGDEATRDALVALQSAGVSASLEHAQLLRRQDLPLFAAAGITASLQPAHLVDDAPAVDDLWRGTDSLPYAVRSVVEAGARMVFGSDAPVSPLDPWRSIAAAVHRTDGSAPPWHPQEAVDLEVALAASGARRLRIGDAADIVVLEEPPYGLSAADLLRVPVHATFVGGRCVHGPWSGSGVAVLLDPTDHTGDDQAGRGDTFVVQEHHATALHWDLRLERDGVLVSWALPKGLPLDPTVNRLAVPTEDHALAHADVGGDVSGQGRVTIWDRGSYELLEWRPGKVKVVLHGRRVQGRYVLFRTGLDWMVHRMDPPPEGWSPLPRGLLPVLPVPGNLPPDADTWSYEPAWSGLPVLVAVEGGRLRVLDAEGADVTAAFPELRPLGLQLGSRQVLLDGELVEDRPDRGRLARRGAGRPGRALLRDAPVRLLLGDLLHDDGHALLELPWAQRRAALDALQLAGPHWQVPPAYVGGGQAVLAAARAQGLPGVLARRREAPYGEPAVLAAT